MKITRLIIKNFRSIEKVDIEINNLIAIVGENNNGKSAILRALNSFFNIEEEVSNFYNESHRYKSNSKTSEISIEFEGINDIELREDIINNKITIIFRYNYSKRKYGYFLPGKGNKSIHNDILDRVFEEFNFILIPTNRGGEELTINEGTILNRVLLTKLQNQTKQRDLVTPRVQAVLKDIQKLVFDNLSTEIDKLYPIKKKFKLGVEYFKGTDYSILMDRIGVVIKEVNQENNAQDCGSGVQSMVTIAMYRYLAKLNNTKFIIAIEEPEINLHPQAQREFIINLQRYSNDLQVFITTHSATIVDYLQHEDIVLVKKEKIDDIKRDFKTVAYQLKKNFFERNGLDEFKYYQFHRYKNSEFLFSKLVVVTESKNEIEIIKEIFRKNNIDIEYEGIDFFELGGENRLKYAYYLLKELEIPYLIILDRDVFTTYVNGDLKNSRDSSGFPIYSQSYNNVNLEIIEKLIPNVVDRNALLKNFNKNSVSGYLKILQKYNIVSMKYCLEMDLLKSKKAQDVYYDLLNIHPRDRNVKYLLVNNKKSIKKIENMISVTKSIDNKNLPYSYRYIKNIILERLKNI